VQHIEFFDIDHFENNYYRVKAVGNLSLFIDFFWETKFDLLLQENPRGFSDALFPNIGYTYLINLGTPFVMQVDERRFEMRTDGFLPRHKAIECYHRPGNCLFGIKFKASPVILEKPVNFSEYKNYIFPLAYLIDGGILNQVKSADNFNSRLELLSKYFENTIKKYSGSLHTVNIVTNIIDELNHSNDFAISIGEIAHKYQISTRTLERYFETNTSLSSKQALQILRIRKATHHLATSPSDFHYSLYGYYDHSHFYKHLKSFLQKTTLENLQPHLKLLKALHRI
jgi:AraC-like DNA-binding protein